MRKRMLQIMASVLVLAVVMSYSMVTQVGDVTAASKKGVKKVTITNVLSKKITIGKGKKLKLQTSVALDKGSKASKKVVFKSSNTSVATVSKSGLVKAKKIGKTTITVSAKDNAGKKATLKVTVAKKGVKIKKISLKKSVTLHIPVADESDDDEDYDEDEEEDDEDYDEDEDDEDDEDWDDEDEEYEDDDILYALKAKVYPVNASNQNLKWSSSNKKVVTVSKKGVIKVEGDGKAVITVKATDGSKKKASCKVTVIDDMDLEQGDDGEDEE